jgi:hypothetical protein
MVALSRLLIGISWLLAVVLGGQNAPTLTGKYLFAYFTGNGVG